METRRSFLKKASLLAGSTALASTMPGSILRAMAINADPGTSYLDAEHIVFLMQENRSFDHCYGRLKGVRGFNDPRAIDLPTGLPVWFQRNSKGQTFAPFRLDIKNTKATWMGSLPHGWNDMVEARNHGKMNKWLDAKKSGNPDYQKLPLTMGHYDREDIPFYYALADAFTVCDQSFCSTLTGTSPNRCYFWAGTVREEPHNPDATAHVNNGQIDFKDVSWKTYPERLEEAGISWGVYQNELSIPSGLSDDEDYWLANFTDNDLEFTKQYHVRFHPLHRKFMQSELERLTQLEQSGKLKGDELEKNRATIERLKNDLETYSEANFEKLSEQEKAIHRKAFITNMNDPHYRQLESLEFDGQKVGVPKGDVLHQFRKDVNEGTLPMVSWLVAPCAFSDHPGSPWFGAWYVSEALDILTKNPEVWKKTIFVLTYDENDGYFDHMPPFAAPRQGSANDGATTQIPTDEEFVDGKDNLGLGFRVPMVIASPWSKGGFVNSEVFDHTSSLQFLEHFIETKTGKKVIEENIGTWRRAVCGDLTSVFRKADDSPASQDLLVDRNKYIERIYSAKNKKLPGDFKALDDQTIRNLQSNNKLGQYFPKQESGTKPACAIPYNLSLDTKIQPDEKALAFTFGCQPGLAKTKTITAPFQLYDLLALKNNQGQACYNFAVTEGKELGYSIPQHSDDYYFKGHGPNGFYREFKGKFSHSPEIHVQVSHLGHSGQLQIAIQKPGSKKLDIQLVDNSYKRANETFRLKDKSKEIFLNLSSSSGWYDYSLKVEGYPEFEQRFAGHVENGKTSMTDPLLGGVI
ncbi:phosphocholine-specific phospholipase C [Prolixibacter bellariivorans]|nr:phospholipase C, phosphocholine-specific [Prolixibacter bellariivorans]